jgi:hypothetical protein
VRAVVLTGQREVSIETVADAELEAPTDALLRITSRAIYGTDLTSTSTRGGWAPSPGWPTPVTNRRLRLRGLLGARVLVCGDPLGIPEGTRQAGGVSARRLRVREQVGNRDELAVTVSAPSHVAGTSSGFGGCMSMRLVQATCDVFTASAQPSWRAAGVLRFGLAGSASRRADDRPHARLAVCRAEEGLRDADHGTPVPA